MKKFSSMARKWPKNKQKKTNKSLFLLPLSHFKAINSLKLRWGVGWGRNVVGVSLYKRSKWRSKTTDWRTHPPREWPPRPLGPFDSLRRGGEGNWHLDLGNGCWHLLIVFPSQNATFLCFFQRLKFVRVLFQHLLHIIFRRIQHEKDGHKKLTCINHNFDGL